jgi:hypothetical protein
MYIGASFSDFKLLFREGVQNKGENVASDTRINKSHH